MGEKDLRWEELKSRNRRQHDDRGSVWVDRSGKANREDEAISSFLFTNYLKDFGAKELFETFKEYGLVHEVYILRKKAKRGKRYGFVLFRKAKDVMRGKLKQGSKTLWVTNMVISITNWTGIKDPVT
ncbi:unnamed protein product [Lathyrus sativus]|nr:unnamed protein product [Lathyrus sativus]